MDADCVHDPCLPLTGWRGAGAGLVSRCFGQGGCSINTLGEHSSYPGQVTSSIPLNARTGPGASFPTTVLRAASDPAPTAALAMRARLDRTVHPQRLAPRSETTPRQLADCAACS